MSINSSGQVAGYFKPNNSTTYHAFQYSNGAMHDLGAFGGIESKAYSINSNGQVTGSFVKSNAALGDYHAFQYENNVIHDLGSLGGNGIYGGGSVAKYITDNGQVVGLSRTSDGYNRHAFSYSNGVMHDLGTLGGSESAANGANANGQIVGWADPHGAVTDYGQHAFLYSNGVMHDLGTLGGSISNANSINASGQVVGESNTSGNAATHAFLYSNGVMLDIGGLGESSKAKSINSIGQVVGAYSDSSQHTFAFLYSSGSIIDLNTLINPNLGWTLNEAFSINESGQIAGYGTINGQIQAFLLTPTTSTNPIPIPSTFWLFANSLINLVIFHRRFYTKHYEFI